MKYRNRCKVEFSKAPSEASNKYFLPKHFSNFGFLFPGMAVVSSPVLDTIRMFFIGCFPILWWLAWKYLEVLPWLKNSPRQSTKCHLQSLHLKQQHIHKTISPLKSALKFLHYSWFQRIGPLSVRKCSSYICDINLAKPLTWKKMNVKIPVLNCMLNQDSWLQRMSLSTLFITECKVEWMGIKKHGEKKTEMSQTLIH